MDNNKLIKGGCSLMALGGCGIPLLMLVVFVIAGILGALFGK